MGYICRACGTYTQSQKANRVALEVRKVLYKHPSGVTTKGLEFVKEATLCSKCYEQHKGDSPQVSLQEKYVVIKKETIQAETPIDLILKSVRK